MKKILLTGFEAFNGRSINPSRMIVEKITTPAGVTLIKKILPVEFIKTTEILTETIVAERPDIVLSIGQAGNVPHISVERVAVNLDNCMASDGMNVLPDSAGDAAIDRKIFDDGENAYFSTLPVWDLVRSVNAAGIPCRASYSAGTYVCNHVMYVAAYLAARQGSMLTGFVHVPFLPEQLDKGSTCKNVMTLDDMVKGVQEILCYLSKN